MLRGYTGRSIAKYVRRVSLPRVNDLDASFVGRHKRQQRISAIALVALLILATISTAFGTSAASGNPNATVTLSADATALPANITGTVLTATPSAPLTSGYYIMIVDSAGTILRACSPSDTACRQSVGISPGSSQTYTALITQGTSSAAVASPLARSEPVTITRATWTVTLSTPDNTLTPSTSYAPVFADLDSPVTTGYGVSLMSSTGQLLNYCAGSCYANVAIPESGAITIWAFVTKGPPTNGELPRDIAAKGRPLTITTLDGLALLASDAVAQAEASLLTRYGGQLAACAALGEATRTYALRSSVPDATLVCTTSGIRAALEFIARSQGIAKTVMAVETLAGANYDDESLNPFPDCHFLDANGYCLDEGSPSASPPAPEPGTGAGGIRPPPNCLDDAQKAQILLGMPEQYHHAATRYGAWAKEFQEIVNNYGLTVEATARDWNVIYVQHRGPHPAEYHQWVLDNMRLAAQLAGNDKDVFFQLFKEFVIDEIIADPTITRFGYWHC